MNLKSEMTPVVWSIAGADPSGGAGLLADTRAITALGGHACAIVSALTAQNSREFSRLTAVDADFLHAQIETLIADLPPRAVKIGLLADGTSVSEVKRALTTLASDVPVVLDPVISASAGREFWSEEIVDRVRSELLPSVSVLTPNLGEAERLSGYPITSPGEIEAAARVLRTMGPKTVIIKGGHGSGGFSRDFYLGESGQAWLTLPRLAGAEARGTGCTFSAALATALAFGFGTLDAAVIAKTYLNQTLRRRTRHGGGAAILPAVGWPGDNLDLPWLNATAFEERLRFRDCGPEPLGFYPIVDRAAWLKRLLPLGITTAQLRIKDLTGIPLAEEIRAAVAIARLYKCRLFINDHWRLALEYGAYGAHLGQEDLDDADLPLLARSGLRLGVSTHSYTELARAAALNPSYVALGPIFPTTIKAMRFGPQGLENLRVWRALAGPTPLVAIGGITLEKADEVLAAGPDGIAVVSDLTGNPRPDERALSWLERFRKVPRSERRDRSTHADAVGIP